MSEGLFDMFFGQGAEAEYEAVDLNGDGEMDAIITYEDFTNDNVFDSMIVSADTDGDGIIDLETVHIDQDGDGTIDYSALSMAVDTDGDNVADALYFAEDIGSDGSFETETLVGEDDLDIYDDGSDVEPVEQDYSYSDGYEQFNPEETDMDQVVGAPSDEAYWEYQGESGPCAIYAQVMAFEGMTGYDIDPEEMIEVATEYGWYNGAGTSISDMDKILNYLGADTELGYNGDMDDIRECLENGGRVVVAVDGNEIWFNDSETYAPNDPNHAITVIGIDYSGEEPMVIINDSGTPDGSAIMVPESQFMDAWEDSGFSYVEAYA